MADALSGFGGGAARNSAAEDNTSQGPEDGTSQEAAFQQAIEEALIGFVIGDVISDQLKSEANLRELEQENETAG